MKTNKKPIDKKKIMSIAGTVTVLVIFAVVAIVAFFGRGDNTRTHFDTVKGESYHTDGIFDGQNEFLSFEYNIVDSQHLVFDDSFKQMYPQISEVLADKDFCASETEVKSISFEEGTLVLDAYSYTADYSVRYLDMMYISHTADDNRNIIFSKPYRYTVKFDTTLALVELQTLDVANFRLNPYNVSLNVEIGNKADAWNISADTVLGVKDEQIAKTVSESIDIINENGESILTSNTSGKETVKQSATITGSRNFKIKLDYNDQMFTAFDRMTVKMVSDDGYSCDSAKFYITVNEE